MPYCLNNVLLFSLLQYNGTKVQLLDLPGIIEGAAHGKGRGKEVLSLAFSLMLF
jgi:ribosome-interacting GTPase 1